MKEDESTLAMDLPIDPTLVAEGRLTEWERNFLMDTYKRDKDAGRNLNHYHKFYPSLFGVKKA
tara:strand:- start:121 stop:309 length:189 start_codon:yes stop_codon:yes gene_type:complete